VRGLLQGKTAKAGRDASDKSGSERQAANVGACLLLLLAKDEVLLSRCPR